jgi:hypothetical protein
MERLGRHFPEIYQIGKPNQNQKYSSNAYGVEPRCQKVKSRTEYGTDASMDLPFQDMIYYE